MKQDPISNFIELQRKIQIVVSKESSSRDKRDMKRYLIEIFNNRVLNNPKASTPSIKQELSKVIEIQRRKLIRVNSYKPRLFNTVLSLLTSLKPTYFQILAASKEEMGIFKEVEFPLDLNVKSNKTHPNSHISLLPLFITSFPLSNIRQQTNFLLQVQ